MTVKDAAIQTLRKAGHSLTVAEIISIIDAENLFTFRTSGKRGVVLATLKRHAVNAHSCTPAKSKSFRQLEGDRFELL